MVVFKKLAVWVAFLLVSITSYFFEENSPNSRGSLWVIVGLMITSILLMVQIFRMKDTRLFEKLLLILVFLFSQIGSIQILFMVIIWSVNGFAP